MTETFDVEQPKTDTAAKRARIEQELRENPQRSDREIARVAGVDHKTVGAHRERLGIASPLGNSPCEPTPTDRRHTLIKAAEHFNQLYPRGPAESATAEEQVDEAIANGAVSLVAPDESMYWAIPHQAKIECSVLADGAVEIRQEGQHGPDEDSVIHVAAGNAVKLARHVLYAAGFTSIGIYTYEKGGCVDIEDGDLASNYYKDRPGYGPVR